MSLPRRQVATMVAKQTLEPSLDRKALARSIAAYLLDTNSTGELESLLRDIAQYRADKGIVEVTALSAHELSTQVRSDIETLVRAWYPTVTSVIINERRDAAVIGGVRLELVDRQLDLSIRSRLNRLKQLTATERMTR